MPAGSYLGALIGWRGVFVAAAGLGALAPLVQMATLPALPAAMTVLALLLSGAGGLAAADAAMIALWGLVFAGVPVAWSTWITRILPDEAEAGGGLLVAAINFAIALGAGLGGAVLDLGGPRAVFLLSGVLLALAAGLILARRRGV